MSDEITREQAREVLALELGGNDSGKPTVHGYLVELLRTLWRQEQGFSGKRPFGNSGWQSDLYLPMIKEGMIRGEVDEDGYLLSVDDAAADRLILAAIDALDGDQLATVSE